MIRMEARELRLNNYVLCQWTEEEFSDELDDYIEVKKEKIGKVVQLDCTETRNYSIYVETKSDEGVPIEDIDQILPIPLTEDWLERFGFRKSHRGKFEHDNLPYDIYGGTGLYMHGVKPEIKHVHQLQNLYFALTGEELTLKTE